MVVKFKAALLIFSLFQILYTPLSNAEKDNILSHEQIVTQYVDAFNRKNTAMMLNHATENIVWMSVNEEKISVETRGDLALIKTLQSYFKTTPSARSEILSISGAGPFVYTVEKASWKSNEQLKSQCSSTVYQFENSKIKYVWYFAAYQC